VAFSWDIGPSTYFYRADIFEEVGLPSDPEEVAKLISTWAGVLEAAKKVNIPGQRWLLPDAVTLYQTFFHNRNFYDEKLNLMLDRPGDIDCLNVVIEMRKNKLDMNAGMWGTEGYAALDTGGLVSVITGSWYGGFLKDDIDPDGAGNWRATVLPGGLSGMGIGGSFLVIPKQGKHPAEAWALLEYLCATAKGQNDMFEAVDYFPSFKPAWTDQMYEAGDPYYGGQKTRALWKEISQDMDKPIYTTIMDTTAESTMGTAVTAGIERGLDAAGIKRFVTQEIELATAELKRQQIQTLRDAGVWTD
jgi:multiple sugar transport system substrate-binding protein